MKYKLYNVTALDPKLFWWHKGLNERSSRLLDTVELPMVPQVGWRFWHDDEKGTEYVRWVVMGVEMETWTEFALYVARDIG